MPLANEIFDGVLIDAPCSGLGTIRRDPDIRWRRDPSDFEALANIQRGLLRRVVPLVKPGGRIVYSTCSSEPDENEQVVAAFLAEFPAFAVHRLAAGGLPRPIMQMQTSEGYLRTSPEHGLEAFFGAILVKRANPGF